MVNTFLTCSPTYKDPETGLKGYRYSASKLDFKRLNKQVTEAIQILNLVESFHVLAKHLKFPMPKNPYEWYDWTREIMKKYKALDYHLFFHQGDYIKYKKTNPEPKRLAYDEKYEILENGKILYKEKEYRKYTLVLPGDNFFSMGFWSHPVVIMFLGYSDSLKLYINDHLDEFIARGGKKESIARRRKIENENIEHPIWTFDSMFHITHKASLLTKEIVREEDNHYILFEDFMDAYELFKDESSDTKSSSDFDHYIWPFSQDRENPRYEVLENGKLEFKTCSKSKNYL